MNLKKLLTTDLNHTDFVFLKSYQVRQSGERGVEVTLPGDRGIAAKTSMAMFAIAGLPAGVLLLVPESAIEEAKAEGGQE
jgi:hypothetical protein